MPLLMKLLLVSRVKLKDCSTIAQFTSFPAGQIV